MDSKPSVVPLWINGRSAAASPAVTFPISLDEQGNTASAQSADVEAAQLAAAAAKKAFEQWRLSSPTFRRDILLRAAGLLDSRRAELVALQVLETNCAEAWAQFNIDNSINNMREIAARITSACTGSIPAIGSEKNLGLVFKEPVGPVLLIAPWNASVILASRGLSSILGAGCTVVFKTSEICPRVHHLLVKVFIEAGVPADAINAIQVRREDASEVTEALISHSAIRKVEFIGSAAVGRIIGAMAGKHLKPVLMELGGKCASIILDDCELEDAAEKCLIGDQFIQLLKRGAAEWPTGKGVNREVVQKSCDKLLDADEKGAQFLTGGPSYASELSLQPTILMETTKEMKLWDEETFGPSVSLFVVDTDCEAIELANDSSYGLNAAIHTSNMQRAIDIARKLEVAQVHVNALTEHDDPTYPLGAVKGSGWGRNNASYGLEEFLVPKVVSLNMSRQKLAFEIGGK
ncbi:unnamed protein product [Penicillium pancosmium]